MKITVKPDSKEWHELRQKCVTASDIGTFFDPTSYKTKLSLYYEKLSVTPPSQRSKDDPLYIRLEAGKELEPFVARLMRERMGAAITLDDGFYLHDEVEGYGATPDYRIELEPGEVIDEVRGRTEELCLPITAFDGPGLMEIKTDIFNANSDEPPIKYLAQLQSQLDCTGLKWGCVVTLSDLAYLNVCYYRIDPEATAEIRKQVKKFWNMVENKIQPDPTHRDEDLAIIKAMYPDIINEEYDYSNNATLYDACEIYSQAHREQKANERVCDTQKAVIAQIIEEAKHVRCDPFKIIRYKTEKKEALTVNFKDGCSTKYRFEDLSGELKEIAETMKRRNNKTKTIKGVKYEYSAPSESISMKISEVRS